MDPELKTIPQNGTEPEGENARIALEQAQYAQALEEWNARCAEIRLIHNQVVQRQINRRRDELEMDAGRGYDVMARSQDAVIAEETERRNAAVEELNRPGKMKASRRKELKKTWDEADKKIREAYQKLTALETRYQGDIQQVISQAQLQEPNFRRAAEAAMPFPEKPCDPAVKRAEEERNRNLRIKNAIWNCLRARDGATLNEIAEGVPELNGLGIQQIGEYLRQMWEENAISRVSQNGQVYFKVK